MRKSIFIALASIMLLILVMASGCATSSPTATSANSSIPMENTTLKPSTGPSGSALSFIVATPVPTTPDSTLDYQPPPLKSPPQFSIITQSLTFGDTSPGTNIPLGSTIYHWKNKITEVVGPDNSILFICKDAEAAQIPTPGAGARPATQVVGVPNGARVDQDPNNKNVTKIYSGDKLIGTIVTKPEGFPYAPIQMRNSSQQYVATGLFDDGTSGNITSKVVWNSSNSAVAGVSADGLVTALSDGTANITASLQGITSVPVELTVNSLLSISIADWNGVGAPRTLTSLPIGATWNVYAIGTYSDGSTADIKNEVTWTSSNPGVATVDSDGVITGVSNGEDRITASLYGITSPPISFNVVSLSSIAVSAPEQLKVGSKVWASADGIYSDGSKAGIFSPVTWSSSDTSVATISAEGLVKAVSAGTAEITASANGITSKPVMLTVVATSETP